VLNCRYLVDIEIIPLLHEVTYGATGCPTLLQAAKSAVWKDFARVLATVNTSSLKVTPELTAVVQQSREKDKTRGYSALHYCILHNAPFRLIEKLVRITRRDKSVSAARAT